MNVKKFLKQNSSTVFGIGFCLFLTLFAYLVASGFLEYLLANAEMALVYVVVVSGVSGFIYFGIIEGSREFAQANPKIDTTAFMHGLSKKEYYITKREADEKAAKKEKKQRDRLNFIAKRN